MQLKKEDKNVSKQCNCFRSFLFFSAVCFEIYGYSWSEVLPKPPSQEFIRLTHYVSVQIIWNTYVVLKCVPKIVSFLQLCLSLDFVTLVLYYSAFLQQLLMVLILQSQQFITHLKSEYYRVLISGMSLCENSSGYTVMLYAFGIHAIIQ